MKDITISDDIIYIGADDKDLDLFESQYIVPNGVSYNSYLIKDEQIAIMETIDDRKTKEWFNNLEKALDGRKPDFLIIDSHEKEDHSQSLKLSPSRRSKTSNSKSAGNIFPAIQINPEQL